MSKETLSMKRTLESICVPNARPRNPFAMLARARKGGRHGGHDARTATRQRLQRQLDRLDPQGP
jgi:hypothetical protein